MSICNSSIHDNSSLSSLTELEGEHSKDGNQWISHVLSDKADTGLRGSLNPYVTSCNYPLERHFLSYTHCAPVSKWRPSIEMTRCHRGHDKCANSTVHVLWWGRISLLLVVNIHYDTIEIYSEIYISNYIDNIDS